MKNTLAAAKSFTKKHKQTIVVAASATALLVPVTWLAVTGVQYAIAVGDFLEEHDLIDEWIERINK